MAAGAGAGALAAALLASPASAATFTVTNLNDSGAGSLRQALLDAGTAPGADVIDFAPGVTGTITLASDFPTITESVAITGPGSNALTISGDDAYHVFDLNAVGASGVTISGLTITQSASTALQNRGGAISALDSGLTLNDVHLTNNHATSAVTSTSGGGLHVDNDAGLGDVVISNTVIDHNWASTTNGLSLAGGANITADNVSISDLVVDTNWSQQMGGLVVFAANQATIDNTAITQNHSLSFIGGLSFAGTSARISNSTITGNVADGSVGGGYLGGLGTGAASTALSITNTNISNNSAGSDVGGAIIVALDGQAEIDRLTSTNNFGTLVGGLELLGSGTISSSTIANNHGDGINLGYGFGPVSVATCSQSTSNAIQPATSFNPADTTVRFANTTVSGNSRNGIDDSAHGLTVGAASMAPSRLRPSSCSSPSLAPINVGLVHTLAADNGGEDVVSPSVALFSLIEKPNAAVLAGYGTVTGVDPGLLPLQSVSATVSVVPIEIGSAAWDAGWPDFTPPPATDQRGLPRVVDIIDIGAYEVQEPVALPRFTG